MHLCLDLTAQFLNDRAFVLSKAHSNALLKIISISQHLGAIKHDDVLLLEIERGLRNLSPVVGKRRGEEYDAHVSHSKQAFE